MDLIVDDEPLLERVIVSSTAQAEAPTALLLPPRALLLRDAPNSEEAAATLPPRVRLERLLLLWVASLRCFSALLPPAPPPPILAGTASPPPGVRGVNLPKGSCTLTIVPPTLLRLLPALPLAALLVIPMFEEGAWQGVALGGREGAAVCCRPRSKPRGVSASEGIGVEAVALTLMAGDAEVDGAADVEEEEEETAIVAAAALKLARLVIGAGVKRSPGGEVPNDTDAEAEEDAAA
jgi:hypothetical protein